MPTINVNDQIVVRVQLGTLVALTLGAGASAFTTEFTNAGTPLTPVTYTGSTTWLGPFKTVKDFLIVALGGSVSYSVDAVNPNFLAPQFLTQTGLAVATINSASELVVASVTIPANMLGPHGTVRAWSLWSCVNNANVKTARMRLNGLAGTIFHSQTLTSLTTGQGLCIIRNRGLTNSQVGFEAALNGFATGTGSLVTAAIDTTADVALVLTAQKATGTDAMTLEGYGVEVCPDFT